MNGFFAPPPDPWPEQAPARNAPRWTGRPHGPQISAAISDVLFAESELATVLIAYIDAYPEGFELEISGMTRVAFHELRREGEDAGADIFGRHWPMVGEKRDVLPPQLLRIGIEFADGRTATTISGYDRPIDGPVISPLSGGVSGRGGASGGGVTRFRQGYWISPLPPAGALTVLCEWPDLGISLTRAEIDTKPILEAAERAQTLFPDGHHVLRGGQEWRLGTDSDVAFIAAPTTAGTAVRGMIPPIYAAYCTLQLPQRNERAELLEHERAVIGLLAQVTELQSWWLGYLDTGAHDVVFPFAPRTTPFYGHQYVLVEAGSQEAVTWREEGWNWALPDLMFPADRSWLLSTGWDDTWTCIGGTETLIDRFLSHPTLGPRTELTGPTEEHG